jgi:hypothetical protein
VAQIGSRASTEKREGSGRMRGMMEEGNTTGVGAGRGGIVMIGGERVQWKSSKGTLVE